MRRVRIVLAGLAVAASGVLAAEAGACSCAQQPERKRFAEADGAFVGTLVERRSLAPGGQSFVGSGDPVVNVYRVERRYKGRLGTRVEIRTALSDATCGLTEEVGTRVALYLDRAGGRWESGSCSVSSAGAMRAAAARASRARKRAKTRRARPCRSRRAPRRS